MQSDMGTKLAMDFVFDKITCKAHQNFINIYKGHIKNIYISCPDLLDPKVIEI